MAEKTKLLELFNALSKDLLEDETGPNVHTLIHDYITSGDTEYKEYMHFNDHKYCRNLIATNGTFW